MYFGGFMFIFIVNPISGNNLGNPASLVIRDYCQYKNINYKIFYTEDKNDAIRIADAFKDDEKVTIFSVGGDGTLNEVVNGLANSKAKLGLIPVGSGNDFYRTFKDFKGDKIDLGKVNDRYFINVASLGLDAEIANYANKLKNGKLSNETIYILSLIHEYFKFKPIDIDIDGIDKDSTILTVCNAKYYGGGFKIAPHAKLNDGMFDIIDVKSLNKLEIINLVMKLIKAKHLSSKVVNFYQTDKLSVESIIPLNCNIDGEIIKNTDFNFSIEKEALNVDVENSNYFRNLLVLNKVIKNR